MVYLVLLVSLFGTLQLLTINTYAQSAGENNVIGSIGFKECNFVTNSGQPGAAVVSNVDAQFQKCVGSIIQFFFALALFIIAVRIGIEAFANINPAEAGKAVSNTITLVRDVTVGLLLIGSPSIFLSFFNPTTLSLAGVINLQRLSGPAKGVETTVNENGQTVEKGVLEGGGDKVSALTYEQLTPKLAAELAKDPDAFAIRYKLQLNVIKEKFLAELKKGKIDWSNKKYTSLLNILSDESGLPKNLINQLEPGIHYLNVPYDKDATLVPKLLGYLPFKLKNKPELGEQFYDIQCPDEYKEVLKPFNKLCGSRLTMRRNVNTYNCLNQSYLKNNALTTDQEGDRDECLRTSKITTVENLQ